MAWQKGQTGNPRGRPREAATVKSLARKHSPAAFKRIMKLAKGEEINGAKPSIAEMRRANEYIIDRDLGRPETAESNAGGMFQGAQIVVHTGFQDAPRTLTAPTIDMPVNGTTSSAEPTLEGDEDAGIE